MSRRELPPPPEWCAFFTPGQFVFFLEAVQAYWSARGRRGQLHGGVFHLTEEEGLAQLGLSNVAQLCRRRPMDDWADVVGGHFDAMLAAEVDQAELERRIADLGAVRHQLAVRVYHESFLENIAGQCVYRRDLPGTISALVFDLPTIIRQVRPSELARWGVAPEELFAQGVQNVLDQYEPTWDSTRVDLEEDLSITALTSADFFVPTKALVLAEDPAFQGAAGCLIATPHRHALLCYRIEDLRVIRAITTLVPIVRGMHREGPGSLSPLLYWHRRGHTQILPATLGERGVVLSPPDEFITMLGGLSDPE